MLYPNPICDCQIRLVESTPNLATYTNSHGDTFHSRNGVAIDIETDPFFHIFFFISGMKSDVMRTYINNLIQLAVT